MQMIYNIANPSDPYTIECPDVEIATVACVMLGRGQYAFQPMLEGGVEIPFFLFGGVDEFCQARFNKDLATAVQHCTGPRAMELADALDSVFIGDLTDRRAFYALAPTQPREEFERVRNAIHDTKRSSLNDIGGRAYEMARLLRAKAANPIVPAPQQVFRT